MRRTRLLMPPMAALAALWAAVLPAVESDPPVGDGEGDYSPISQEDRARALLDDLEFEGQLLRRGRQATATYHFEQGQRAMEANDLPLAMRHLVRAVDYMPDNDEYRRLLEQVRALAGMERSATGIHTDRLNEELRVRQQELWVEILNRIEESEAHIARGEYNQATMTLEQARIRLENLPFVDERREQHMRRVERLLSEAGQRRRTYEIEVQSAETEQARQRAEERRRYELQLEEDRIDAMLRRALKARERRDYDKAILLCERVLRINRANAFAHGLIARSRRERHRYMRQITADRWDHEHKILSEHIRESLLPQMDYVVYSDDWPEIDARRSAPVHGFERQDEAWRDEIRRKMEHQLTIDFPELEIQEVVAFLQRVTDVNFVLDPRVMASGMAPPITMQVRGIRLSNALDFIMLQTGLRYTLQDEAVFITTPEQVRGDAFMKIYEIRDMMVGLTQFPGPRLTIPEAGGRGGSMIEIPVIEDDGAPTADDFIEIIQTVVRPDSWRDQADVGIREWSGALIVTQTADVHEEIDRLLRGLRTQQTAQINVKVRFLSVENAMLEEIGIQWNNFTGPAGWPAPLAAGPNPATAGAGAPPWWLGGYWRSNDPAPDHIVGAQVTNELQDYHSSSFLDPTGGFTGDIQIFEDVTGFLGRMLINAVTKSRRGNITIQPDITMMSGQRSHISRLNQQSYIGDYSVVGSMYEPEVLMLNYGTVLDVKAVASSDRKWITMTLRPTTTQVVAWRRFGNALADFGGSSVVNEDGEGNALPYFAQGFAGAYPLMVPEVEFKAVETSATIPDGGSLLIAGFTNSVSSRAHAGIPFLSHIPFLGRLFSSNGRAEREYKDLVYVTGEIIIFDEIEANL